jgi:hypothetical protein
VLGPGPPRDPRGHDTAISLAHTKEKRMIRKLAIPAIGLGTIAASFGCSSAGTSPAEPTGTTAAALQAFGGPDLLWQNTTAGTVEAWLLNGTQVDPTPLILSQICGSSDGCSSQWTVVDTVQSSILWWNKSTGHIRTWNFDSSGNVTIPSDPTQTCGQQDGCVDPPVHDWRPIGRVTMMVPPAPGCTGFCPALPSTGLVWHDPITGTVRIWVFDGNGQVEGSFDLTQTCGSALCSQSWTAKLTSDFDGDGNTDILWWNTSTGQLQEWLLNPPSTLSPIPATVAPKQVGVTLSQTCQDTGVANSCGEDWRPVSAADINGDGHVDLLWHNFNGTYPGAIPGALRNWLLNGSGGVTGTQDLSQQCGPNCSPPWTALGYVFFPQQPPR